MALPLKKGLTRPLARPPAKTMGSLTKKTLLNTGAKIAKKAPAAKSGFGVRGKSGWETTTEVNKQRQRNFEKSKLPFRLRMKPGETATVVILDKGEPFFFWEHQWEENGHWGNHETCIKELGHCPLCSSLGKEGHWVMMLTCIDTRKYTDKEGGVHVNTRKLLPIKAGMIPKYKRLFDKNGGSLQGMKLKLSRDGKKDPNTGNDFDVLGKVKLAELAKFGDKAKALNYEEAFKPMDADAMAKVYGGQSSGTAMGSEDTAADSDLDKADWSATD